MSAVESEDQESLVKIFLSFWQKAWVKLNNINKKSEYVEVNDSEGVGNPHR